MNRSRLGRSVVVGAVLGILAAGAIATAAIAHTALTDSTPGDGQTVTELDRVRLEFSGALLEIGASLTVASDNAQPVELQVEFTAANAIEAAVPALESGAYVLLWRVVAEDGHPIEGEIAFQVDAPAPAQPSPTASPDTPATPASTEPNLAVIDLNGDFGEKVSQNLSPLDALLIALVGAALVTIAWFITRRVAARERQHR